MRNSCILRHYDPQHVSSSTLLILRRTNCITTTSGIVTLCKQPCSMQVENGLSQNGIFIPIKYYVELKMANIVSMP